MAGKARKVIVVYAALIVIAVGAGMFMRDPEESSAYSWSSSTYYLRNNHGTYNYSYRSTQFMWQAWNGYLVAIPQISFSARIPSSGWAYYGWRLGAYPAWFGGWTDKASSTEEPTFAMDVNNGWVSRSRTAFGDLFVQPGGYGEAFTFLCENANDCATNTTAWYGAYVGGAMNYQATTGYFNGAAH